MSSASTDGRPAPPAEGRAAIVDAMLGLLNDGRAEPSLTDVAARVGMSADEVLGHFDGADDLRREVIGLHLHRVRSLLDSAGDPRGPLADRVRLYVDARVEFNASMAGTGRAAHDRGQVPEIAAAVEEVRQMWREHTRTQFGAELAPLSPADADAVVTTVEQMFRFGVWDELVSVQGRSTEQIRRAWTRQLLAQLPAPEPRP